MCDLDCSQLLGVLNASRRSHERRTTNNLICKAPSPTLYAAAFQPKHRQASPVAAQELFKLPSSRACWRSIAAFRCTIRRTAFGTLARELLDPRVKMLLHLMPAEAPLNCGLAQRPAVGAEPSSATVEACSGCNKTLLVRHGDPAATANAGRQVLVSVEIA